MHSRGESEGRLYGKKSRPWFAPSLCPFVCEKRQIKSEYDEKSVDAKRRGEEKSNAGVKARAAPQAVACSARLDLPAATAPSLQSGRGSRAPPELRLRRHARGGREEERALDDGLLGGGRRRPQEELHGTALAVEGDVRASPRAGVPHRRGNPREQALRRLGGVLERESDMPELVIPARG